MADKIFEQRNRLITVSRITLVEIRSAIAVKVRTRQLREKDAAAVLERFEDDLSFGELQAVAVRGLHFAHAERLIARHAQQKALRTLDAIQLAVALNLSSQGLIDHFVAADQTLLEVAAAEGLSVISPGTA